MTRLRCDGSWNLLVRAWFYMRQGYNYLSLPRSLFISLAGAYILIEQGFPAIRDHVLEFGVTFMIASSLICVVTGWVYMKRSTLLTTEIDVGVEANPYNFKLPPGYWRDAIAPALLLLLAGHHGREVDEIRRKLRLLADGGSLLAEGKMERF